MQLVSKCYTVVSYKAVFRLYTNTKSAVYLSEYRVRFEIQDTAIEVHDYLFPASDKVLIYECDKSSIGKIKA